MNVSLTPELEQFIGRKVESGLYDSASEVVREGLRLLKKRDETYQRRLEEIRKEVAIGLEEAERGEVSPFNEAILAEIKAEGRKRLEAERGHRPEPS